MITHSKSLQIGTGMVLAGVVALATPSVGLCDAVLNTSSSYQNSWIYGYTSDSGDLWNQSSVPGWSPVFTDAFSNSTSGQFGSVAGDAAGNSSFSGFAAGMPTTFRGYTATHTAHVATETGVNTTANASIAESTSLVLFSIVGQTEHFSYSGSIDVAGSGATVQYTYAGTALLRNETLGQDILLEMQIISNGGDSGSGGTWMIQGDLPVGDYRLFVDAYAVVLAGAGQMGEGSITVSEDFQLVPLPLGAGMGLAGLAMAGAIGVIRRRRV